MAAHSPAGMPRVMPDQPISNWAAWLRDIARAVNQLIGLADRPALTFATLPADALPGWQAYITDCNTAAWGAVAAGGGTTHALVWWNGTAWHVLGA
jgi:hypothetical protein